MKYQEMNDDELRSEVIILFGLENIRDTLIKSVAYPDFLRDYATLNEWIEMWLMIYFSMKVSCHHLPDQVFLDC